MEDGFLLAPAVARLLGIKTSTLKKWRLKGQGPKGARHLSPTAVIYPIRDVQEFLRSLHELPVSPAQEGGCRDEKGSTWGEGSGSSRTSI